MVEHVLSMCVTLGSIPNTKKRKEKKNGSSKYKLQVPKSICSQDSGSNPSSGDTMEDQGRVAEHLSPPPYPAQRPVGPSVRSYGTGGDTRAWKVRAGLEPMSPTARLGLLVLLPGSGCRGIAWGWDLASPPRAGAVARRKTQSSSGPGGRGSCGGGCPGIAAKISSGFL